LPDGGASAKYYSLLPKWSDLRFGQRVLRWNHTDRPNQWCQYQRRRCQPHLLQHLVSLYGGIEAARSLCRQTLRSPSCFVLLADPTLSPGFGEGWGAYSEQWSSSD